MSDETDDNVHSLFRPGSTRKERARRREELRKAISDREKAAQKEQDDEAMGVANSPKKWKTPESVEPMSLTEFLVLIRKYMEETNLRLSAIEKTQFHILLETEVLSRRHAEEESDEEEGDLE